jgi:hypothetical protein
VQIRARRRDRRGSLGKRAGSGAQKKQEDYYKTTAHQLNLDNL